ncbi:MAG: hypothetical protein LRY73_15820 [Bacillus sp. (in: Bacteria)]|nr:hypothetical protein [Bacillus sp. (in: firmicutes)]
MNPIVLVFSMIGAIFLVFVIRLLSLTSVGPSMTSAPWWVYLVYLAIVFSGVMFVYSWVDDKQKEQKVIEDEGKKILQLYKNNRVNRIPDESGSKAVEDGLNEEWKRYSL